MTWLGKKAAWFTLHKSENEDIDIGDALVREKGIGRRGRIRCAKTEEAGSD